MRATRLGEMSAARPTTAAPVQGSGGRRPLGLKARIAAVFVLQAAAISFGAVLGIYAAAAVIEDLLIKRALVEEAEHFFARRAENPAHQLPDTHNMRGYLRAAGGEDEDPDRPPPHLANLPPGFHNLRLPDEHPLVYVSDGDLGRLYLSFDQQHVGHLALFFGLLPLAVVLMIIYLTTFLAYRLSRRALSPVVWLAGEVRRWDPSRPGDALFAGEAPPRDLDGESQVLADAFHQLRTRLQGHIARERTFTRDASHELRSPLTVIRVASDVLLAEEDLDSYVRRNLQRIQRASRDMEALIEAFLILARDADTGLQSEDFLVNTVVREELERAEALVANKELALVLVEDVHLMLHAPPKVVAVLLGNLIRNAVAYTLRGEVRVRVSEGEVVIGDTGCGMDETELAQAFQPFYRAHAEQPGGQGGHGVGLSIVRRLSERFDWPVSLTSRKGVGTEARVRFPSAWVAGLEASRGSPSAQVPEG